MGTIFVSFVGGVLGSGSLLRVSPIDPDIGVFDGEDKLVFILVAPINTNLMIIDGEDKVTAFPLKAFNT